MNMHAPSGQFNAPAVLAQHHLQQLETMASALPENEREWIEQGHHIWCRDADDRKVGGPVFSFPHRRFILAASPARILEICSRMSELENENCQLRADLQVARERAA